MTKKAELETVVFVLRLATMPHPEFQKIIDQTVKALWRMSGEFTFQCPHCQQVFTNPIDSESHITEYGVNVPVRGVYLT